MPVVTCMKATVRVRFTLGSYGNAGEEQMMPEAESDGSGTDEQIVRESQCWQKIEDSNTVGNRNRNSWHEEATVVEASLLLFSAALLCCSSLLLFSVALPAQRLRLPPIRALSAGNEPDSTGAEMPLLTHPLSLSLSPSFLPQQ